MSGYCLTVNELCLLREKINGEKEKINCFLKTPTHRYFVFFTILFMVLSSFTLYMVCRVENSVQLWLWLHPGYGESTLYLIQNKYRMYFHACILKSNAFLNELYNKYKFTWTWKENTGAFYICHSIIRFFCTICMVENPCLVFGLTHNTVVT